MKDKYCVNCKYHKELGFYGSIRLKEFITEKCTEGKGIWRTKEKRVD